MFGWSKQAKEIVERIEFIEEQDKKRKTGKIWKSLKE